jgi:hypothetical protein
MKGVPLLRNVLSRFGVGACHCPHSVAFNEFEASWKYTNMALRRVYGHGDIGMVSVNHMHGMWFGLWSLEVAWNLTTIREQVYKVHGDRVVHSALDLM